MKRGGLCNSQSLSRKDKQNENYEVIVMDSTISQPMAYVFFSFFLNVLFLNIFRIAPGLPNITELNL